jgi:hypothetical protein
MGYAISWLAVHGATEASVFASLGLEKTDKTEEIPESDWCSTCVGDWILIWSNRFDPRKFRDAPSKLEREVVICHVEEHVMFVSASSVNEALSWRVVDDSQKARDHLVVEGRPPESFARIQAEELARVDSDHEVDFIFEIPVRVAQELVGSRHDEATKRTFNILRDVDAGTGSQKSKWKFW